MKPQKKRWLSMLLVLALAAGGIGGVSRPIVYAAEMDEAENGGATEDKEGRNTEKEPGGATSTDPENGHGSGTPGTDPDDGDGDGVPGIDPDDGDGDGVPGIDPDDGHGSGTPGTDLDDGDGDGVPGIDPDDGHGSGTPGTDLDDGDGDGVPGIDPDDGDGDGVPGIDPDDGDGDGVPGIDPDDGDGDDVPATDAEDEDDSENGEEEAENEETTDDEDEDPGIPEAGVPVAQLLAEGILLQMGVFGAPPSPVDGLWPDSGSVDVDVEAPLVITFSGPITYESGKFITIRESNGTGFLTISTDSIRISGSGENIVIINHRGLKPNTTYYVEIDGGAFTAGGVSFSGFTGDGIWYFTTGSLKNPSGDGNNNMDGGGSSRGDNSSNGDNPSDDDASPLQTVVNITLRYETEDGTSLGSQHITTASGNTLSPEDLDLPGGYRLKDSNWRYKADSSGILAVILEPVPEEPALEQGEPEEPPLILLIDMPHYVDQDTGAVMVALRPMAEAAGVDGNNIQWDEAEQRVTVTYPETGITMDFIAGETITRITYPTVQPHPGGDTEPEIIINEAGHDIAVNSYVSTNKKDVDPFVSTSEKDVDLEIYLADKNSKINDTSIDSSGTASEGTDGDGNAGANNGEPAGDTEPKIIINEAEYKKFGKLYDGRKYYAYADNSPSEDAEDTIDTMYPEIETIYHLETISTQNQPANGADAGEPAGDTEPNGKPAGASSGGGAYDVQTSVVLDDGTVLLFVSSQAGPREVKPAAITIPNGAAPATDSVGYGGVEEYIVYEDLSGYGWAEGYISYAQGAGIVSGYGDGTFEPGNIVSYDEAVTMVVSALGYTNTNMNGSWPASYISQDEDLGASSAGDSSRSQASPGETQPAGMPGSVEGEPLTVSQNDPPERDTEMSAGYTDIRSSDWKYESVEYNKDKGLYSGTSDTSFSPDTGMTRGMAITILDDPDKEYIELVADLPAPPALEEGSMYVPLEAFRFIEVFMHSGLAISLPDESIVYVEDGQLLSEPHEIVNMPEKYY